MSDASSLDALRKDIDEKWRRDELKLSTLHHLNDVAEYIRSLEEDSLRRKATEWKVCRFKLPSGHDVVVGTDGDILRMRGKHIAPLQVELLNAYTQRGLIEHHTLRTEVYDKPYGCGLESVRARVEMELEQERIREMIDKEKDRIMQRRNRRPWWHKLFPYTVSINRRDES